MDDSNHHIDEAFKQRFAGLKDHSISPKIGWAQFEAGLAAQSSASVTTGVVHGTFQSFVQLGMAASVAVGLSVTVPGDQLENHTPSTHPISYAELPLATTGTPKLAAVEWPSSSLDVANAPATMTGVIKRSPEANAAPAGQVFNDHGSVASSEEVRSELRLMDAIDASPFDRPAPEIEALDPIRPSASRGSSKHLVFLKGMIRTGTGESNSFEIPSRYMPNAAFAFGYGYQLARTTAITAEVGWVRRSGNGIERRRKLDINPAISGLSNSLGSSEPTRRFVAHEGLVATRMEYIHLPVRIHQAFNARYSFTAGAFADVLIAARNRAFIIYNEEHYQENNRSYSELSTLDGLKRVRYGLTAGLERQIQEHLFVGASIDVPLNSSLALNDEISIIDETNKLVDFRLGLTYRL